MTLAWPLVKPDELAVMVVDPTAEPVMVKVAVALPPETGTLAGMLTTPPGDAKSPTVIPPVGAGALSVIVPFIDLVTPSEPESVVRLMEGVLTLTVAVAGVYGLPDAVMVAVPTPVGVMVTFAPVLPCGTKTLGGTVATARLLLCKLIVCPPEPAGADRVTVRVPAALTPRFSKLSGLGVNVIVGAAAAVMVTVEGLLSTIESLTIN